jgi:phospholipid/cholesterol/gamma-HCH transport system substrate-binding protein
MELRYKREAMVGALLVGAAIVFAFMMMWLRGRTVRPTEVVRATFADVAGLKPGDPVRTSGVQVGRVRDVVLEGPGQVSVYLELTGDAQMPKADARAGIRALDFFGAKFVDYSPGTSARSLDRLQPIRGSREPELGEIGQGLAGQGREFLANATELIAPGTAGELRNVLVQARRTLEQLGEASDRPSAELVRTLESLRRVFQRMDILLAQNTEPAGQAVSSMRDASQSLAQVSATLTRTSASLDSILIKISTGRGLAGQLINDTTIVADLRRTNHALAELLIDFKANPGRYINVSVF